MNWQPNITLYTSAAPVPTSGSIIRPINAATLSKSLRGKKIMLYAFYSETAYHGWNNGGAYKVIQETYFLTLGLSSSGCLRLLFSSFKIQRLYKGRVCLGNWKFLDVFVWEIGSFWTCLFGKLEVFGRVGGGVSDYSNYWYCDWCSDISELSLFKK